MEHHRVLILNKNWMPITHTTWQRAFTLLFKGRVEVLAYYDKSVKTPSTRYLMPAVIRLLHYSKVPNLNVNYSKLAVLERDEYTCQYCNKRLGKGDRTIDHIIPSSQGGRSTFENTVAACVSCNSHKGDRTPAAAGIWLVRKPFIPKTKQYTIYMGTTIPDEWNPFLPLKAIKAIK